MNEDTAPAPPPTDHVTTTVEAAAAHMRRNPSAQDLLYADMDRPDPEEA